MRRRAFQALVVVGGISLVAPRAAHAYIDPQSGSIVFQLLIAGALGALLTIRSWWAAVSGLVRRLFTRTGQ